jgi:hypothetical protein
LIYHYIDILNKPILLFNPINAKKKSSFLDLIIELIYSIFSEKNLNSMGGEISGEQNKNILEINELLKKGDKSSSDADNESSASEEGSSDSNEEQSTEVQDLRDEIERLKKEIQDQKDAIFELASENKNHVDFINDMVDTHGEGILEVNSTHGGSPRNILHNSIEYSREDSPQDSHQDSREDSPQDSLDNSIDNSNRYSGIFILSQVPQTADDLITPEGETSSNINNKRPSSTDIECSDNKKRKN